ncbi:MAG: 4Fe-4S binding protein [Candidatus Zixiibacteriota bacterium]
MSNNYTKQLKNLIQDDLRMPLFGVAKLENITEYIQPELEPGAMHMKYAIVSGLEVSTSVTETIVEIPTLIYKHHYAQLNYLLDRNALQIAHWIMEMGFHAIPIPASQILDFDKQLGHFSHRHAAVEAGIGWMGKNNLFITSEYGAHQRIITILTDLPLEAGKPIENRCGDCRLCIEACPANAISEEGYDFDACYKQLNKFRGIRGIGHHICGFCIQPCKGTRNKI